MTYEEIYKLLKNDDTKVFALDKFELLMDLHDFKDEKFTDEFIDKCYDYYCEWNYPHLDPYEDSIFKFAEYLYDMSNKQNCKITDLNFEKLKEMK